MTTGQSGLLGIDQGLVGRVVCACAMALTLPSCLQTIDRHDKLIGFCENARQLASR